MVSLGSYFIIFVRNNKMTVIDGYKKPVHIHHFIILLLATIFTILKNLDLAEKKSFLLRCQR